MFLRYRARISPTVSAIDVRQDWAQEAMCRVSQMMRLGACDRFDYADQPW